MSAAILDFAAARAAQQTGQPIVAMPWTPPPASTGGVCPVEARDGLAADAGRHSYRAGGARLDDLTKALGFTRGDRVLLPAEPTVDVEPYVAGRSGTIARLFHCPRSGALRAHVQTAWGHVSVPVADLRHAPRDSNLTRN